MAERATAFLGAEPELYLADLIVAETIYVLESFCKAPREQIADAMRSLLAMHSMITVDPAFLLRANRGVRDRPSRLCRGLPVAWAESTGIGRDA